MSAPEPYTVHFLREYVTRTGVLDEVARRTISGPIGEVERAVVHDTLDAFLDVLGGGDA